MNIQKLYFVLTVTALTVPCIFSMDKPKATLAQATAGSTASAASSSNAASQAQPAADATTATQLVLSWNDVARRQKEMTEKYGNDSRNWPDTLEGQAIAFKLPMDFGKAFEGGFAGGKQRMVLKSVAKK